jgi:hypothetical protein
MRYSSVQFVPSQHQIADALTKELSARYHGWARDNLNLIASGVAIEGGCKATKSTKATKSCQNMT